MSAGAIRAGRAFVEFTSDDSKLVQGMQRAQARLREWGASVQRIGVGVAAAGTAILAPMIAATRNFVQVGDELDKLSARTGITVESLSQLKFAADQSGASMEAVGKSVQRMNRRLGRFRATGAGPAGEALQDLGITLDEIESLNSEQMFMRIADAMVEYGDQSAAAGLAQQVFGTEVDKLLPLLMKGSDGIRAMKEEADAAGHTFSREMASDAAELADAMDKVNKTVQAAWLQIGAALAPAITDLVNRVQNLLPDVVAWIGQNHDLVVTVAQVAAVAVGLGTALIVLGTLVRNIGTLISGLIMVMKALGAVMTFIAAHPVALAVGLIVIGLGALIEAFGRVTTGGSVFGHVLDWIADRLGLVRGEIDKMVQSQRELDHASEQVRRARFAREQADDPEEQFRAVQREIQAVKSLRDATVEAHRARLADIDAAERRGELTAEEAAHERRVSRALFEGRRHDSQQRIRELRQMEERLREQVGPRFETPDVPDEIDPPDLPDLETPDLDEIDLDMHVDPDLDTDGMSEQLREAMESAARRSDIAGRLGEDIEAGMREAERRISSVVAVDPHQIAAMRFGELRDPHQVAIEENTSETAESAEASARTANRIYQHLRRTWPPRFS